MTQSTRTRTAATADTGITAIIAAVLLGAGLLFVAGFANAEVLHAAAHDGRHSVSFPCH